MIQHKFFSSQQTDEEVILVIKRHVFELIPPFFVGFLVYFFLILAIILIPVYVPAFARFPIYNVFVLIISIFFLFNTTFLFNTWLLHYLHIAVLTTEHFVEINQINVFSRKISEMGLDKVQDVSASQAGIFATMFNYGQLEVETAGDIPNFVFEYVADPNEVSKRIMEIEEDYCKRHGIRGDGVSGNANMVNNIANHEIAQSQQKTEAFSGNFEEPPENYTKNDENSVE